jgi:sugar phosphate isomerase/epimerase
MKKLSFSIQTSEGTLRPRAAREQLGSMLSMLAKLRFDGVELMPYDCSKLGSREVSELIKSYGLGLSAVGTGILYAKRGLSIADTRKNARETAIKLVNEFLDFASKCGAPILIIGLVRGKVPERCSSQKYMQLFRESVEKIAESAYDRSMILVVEPINRYETNVINTVEDALEFEKKLQHENVKILVDTFHMNIEERDISEAIMKGGNRIKHVHLADSNRLAPGLGHIDFREIINSLDRIDYEGYLSAEVVPKPTLEEAAEYTMKMISTLLTNT